MISVKSKEKVIDIALALGAVLVLGIVLAFLGDYYFDINDDLLMKDILAGVYTGRPSGYNIQMLYPISAFISLFYELFPKEPWYGLFLCGCHFLCFYLIAYRVVSYTTLRIKKVIVLIATLIIFMSLLMWEFLFVQYSVTCGLMAATGTFWFYTSDSSKKPWEFVRENIVSILLVVVAYYIRTEMVLLVFPMICAAGLMKWYDTTKKMRSRFLTKGNNIRFLTVIGGILVGMGMGYAVNNNVYSTPEWKEFNQLFDSRTELYDFLFYDIPEYEVDQAVYTAAGYGPAQDIFIHNYNYLLDSTIQSDSMGKFVEQIRAERTGYFSLSLMEGFEKYIYRLTHKGDAPWIYMIWVCYFAVGVIMLIQKRWSYSWKLLMLFTFRSISWMYIILLERTPPRITTSLFLMELLILVGILICELRQITPKERLRYRKHFPGTVVLVLLILSLGSLSNEIPRISYEQTHREIRNREWKALEVYCRKNPDNLYLIDVYSTVNYSQKMFEDVDNTLSNYHYAGGWACKSPLEKEKLSLFGIENVEMDLCNKDNLFFVSYGSRDVSWIEQVYKEKGIPVIINHIDTIPFEGSETYEVYQIRQTVPFSKGE